MGTVPYLTETPEAKAAREEAEHDDAVRWETEMRRAERIATARRVGQTLLAGGPDLKWRRPLLFVIAAASLAFAGPIGAVGLVALVALAYTDTTTEEVAA